jgi:transposase-like protein
MNCPNCQGYHPVFTFVSARFYTCHDCGYKARYNQHIDARTFEPLGTYYLAHSEMS